MKLEVLICTHGNAGIERLASDGALPRIDDVGYLISWQTPSGDNATIPTALCRQDVRVVTTPTKGVSNNRNNCLDNAIGPLCLMSDDDLDYHPAALRAVIDKMEAHPECGFGMFEYDGADGKYYPAEEYVLAGQFAKNHYLSEPEIAFRLDVIRRSGVRFNPHFGVGNDDYQSGEGAFWIHELMKRGITGRFFPIVIVTHKGLSTGSEDGAVPGVLKAEGAYISVAYPLTAVLRLILVAWRRSRSFGGSPLRHLYHLSKGYLRAVFRPGSLGLK